MTRRPMFDNGSYSPHARGQARRGNGGFARGACGGRRDHACRRWQSPCRRAPHPIQRDDLRALRRLERDIPSPPFDFVSRARLPLHHGRLCSQPCRAVR
jgi:hypothetical protein